MKKLFIVLIIVTILLNFNSCTRDTEGYNIKDALKISAFIFDENSGEDYFIYDALENLKYNDNENVYKLEQLNLNEPKQMKPMGLWLNIGVEFDGIIGVVSEDQDIQIFINTNNFRVPVTGTYGSEHYAFDIKFPLAGYTAITPLGSNTGELWSGGGFEWLRYYIGREYYLSVNAYRFDNEESPIIRARLKIVQLEDKTPGGHIMQKSRVFSIELVSYEYSDMYKMMNEIEDDEDE